ncbi:MAG: hypothetical protein KGS61_05045 [Verrucomicrobia bacterium]|nr:hypothetical protein [Verrucomicrobiota bacterium]
MPVAPPSTPPLAAGALAQLEPPAEGTSPRFTLDGSDDLEQHLAETCQSILRGVRGLIPGRRLEALLLGGGYGRGEGGVLRTARGDRPYNDLEFYVGLRGSDWLNQRRYHAPLHALGEILTPAAGVEVEFKVCSLARLRRRSVTMFSYDLVSGHRWLSGDEALLAGCDPHRLATHLPLAEATRLLMNRCSGLLFAQERLGRRRFNAASADFIARNQAKARLAFGDAVLTRYGQYHWSVRERHRRLQALAPAEPLPWLDAVRRLHEEGVAFKLHPHQSTAPRATLQLEQETLLPLALRLWLWLENHRLEARFDTARHYALDPRDKCPETRPARNRLVNALAFGLPAAFGLEAARYPRQRLLNALTLLLWEPAALREPALLRRLQLELRTNASGFAELVQAYQRLWSRFN